VNSPALSAKAKPLNQKNLGENRLLSTWRKSAGVLPLILFCLAFELIPLAILLYGSVVNKNGSLGIGNFVTVLQNRLYNRSFVMSIEISLLTAVIGTILGGILGYLVYTSGEKVRNFMVSLSSVTANFAGVPLAFAFIVTLGMNGFVTLYLRNSGYDIYKSGFSLYSFLGVAIVYSYFQLPLMVLLIVPAFRGLRPAWVEAASSLGASRAQYWLKVGLPVMFPAIGSTFFLLVANSLGAYATAFGLSSTINLITIQIGFLISGDTSLEPGLASALGVILILLMTVLIAGYQVLGRRSERWLTQ
jgi:putative spermidine/putrescine transport system permease protein